MTPELLRTLDGAVDVFRGTPHGEFLSELAASMRGGGDTRATPDEVIQCGGVQHLRKRHFDRSDVVELCDSHERLRRLWRAAIAAIAQHEFSITEGVRDPVEVDVELWANT